jgi:hypothetical protein
VRRSALALAIAVGGVLLALGCAAKTVATSPRAHHAEPRWQDVFDDMPEVVVVVRPRALKQDKVYGPLLRRVIDLGREWSGVVSATPLEAIEDADEVVIGMSPTKGARDSGAALAVLIGVRADLDPGALVDTGGRAVWALGPSGPVRELVRERDERGRPLEASLFELPGRTWVIAGGTARARARESFAHPFDRPALDFDPQALAIARMDGPSFVARVPRLQNLGSQAAVGRRLRTLTFRLPPGKAAEVELELAYADEDAAAFAEVRVQEMTREKVDGYGWLASASVDRAGKRVVLTVPLPPALVDALLHAGSAGGGFAIPGADPRGP